MEILWNCNPLKKTSDKKKKRREYHFYSYIYMCIQRAKKKYLRSFIIYDSHLSDEMSQYFNLIH